MKKIAVIFMMILPFCLVNAQIQVNSSGHVGLGTGASTTYNLVSSGSNHFSDYVGIGVTPDINFKLKVSGNSSFGGNSNISGSLNISNQNDVPALYVHSNSIHASCAIFNSTTSYYGQGVVLISGGDGYNYVLYVNGDAYSTGSWISSDLQLKKNINILDGKLMLNKIMNIEGKKYEFKNEEELKGIINQSNTGSDDAYSNLATTLPKGTRYGFIAQEVEKEFPELIKTDSISGLKAIDYDGMIPVLLQCIKEQQYRIEALEAINSENEATSKQKISNLISSTDELETTGENALYQNAPNPFSQSTVIEYNLEENASNATICIYNMIGTQLRSVKLSDTGHGKITINAKDLKAGLYLYSLIVDGSLIDTKRMALTD